MRKTLAVMEGVVLPDGRIMENESLYVDKIDTRIPICYANDNPAPHPEGWASDFRRIDHVDHNDLSFEMVMNDEWTDEQLDLYEAWLYCTSLEEAPWPEGASRGLVRRVRAQSAEPRGVVVKARIRMVQLVPIPGVAFGSGVFSQ